MKRETILKRLILMLLLSLLLSCTSYRSYQRAQEHAESKDWDHAVVEYANALAVDPGNLKYRMAMSNAKLEASRVHFEKGKNLRAAALEPGANALELMTLAAGELELTVRLDTTNQYAAIELAKTAAAIQQMTAAAQTQTVDAMKKRVSGKAQPPELHPGSEEPISLLFPKPTPVKDIYRALANAFGINAMFDQSVKDDQRISIELRDVTAWQALERVMQASSHFYKVMDDKTIIVVSDTAQLRRDYEDLVIRTFYLSNGDAEQVTNVVRTMIEARNVFPLKALNAITIRDTADKVRIAAKIIEANDKAKSEVVVDVELLQMNANKTRELGLQLVNADGSSWVPVFKLNDSEGGAVTSLPVKELSNLGAYAWSLNVPSVLAGFLKTNSEAQLLAKPQLRITEDAKATLHIGSRIPVPISTFTSVNPGTGGGSTFAPVTSFQYQDIGIKISIEPRVHHNREVTLKLTVEVSNLQGFAVGTSPQQPIIGTRTIESTIRLKDGETNFLAGLIQKDESTSKAGTPFLSDIPILGRFFSKEKLDTSNTDLVLTMTPHIIRVPDITEEDLAPMWVGTGNNLTFRGMTPRLESSNGADPFNSFPRPNPQGATDEPAQDEGEEEDSGPTVPGTTQGGVVPAPAGSAPSDPFRPSPNPQVPKRKPDGQPMAMYEIPVAPPRIAATPAHLTLRTGEQKVWSLTGMDLEGLETGLISMRYDPRAVEVLSVSVGTAVKVDLLVPPVVTVDASKGLITLAPSSDQPIRFQSGGEVLALNVRGLGGATLLAIEPIELRTANGVRVEAALTGGQAQVE